MRARFVAKLFVPILYQDPAFDAFDDFSDFVESVTCETSKSCQVRGSNPCRGAKPFIVSSLSLTVVQNFVYTGSHGS